MSQHEGTQKETHKIKQAETENLIRLLRIQKRCARLILDANFSDNSVELFTKLGWLPMDDIIRSRKLYLLHKISFGHCPDYFIPYTSKGHS